MSIIFNPTGSLNVSIDPSDLQESSDGLNIQSGEMVRCKNLRLNQKGIAKTRDGASKTGNSVPTGLIFRIDFPPTGIYYVFVNDKIYSPAGAIKTGLTIFDWTTISYSAFNSSTQSVFALNGTDRKRIDGLSNVNEWGIDAPTVAPVNSIVAGGSLTGAYNSKYTYVRKESSVVVCESNPSPAGNSTSLAGQKLGVSVTAPTDPQVTHIRLYRTSANDDIYHYADEVAVGSTTFISNAADSSLGDIVEEDHNRPPAGKFVIGPAFDGTCFIIKDNLLYFCKPKQPEYWPATYFVEVSTLQLPGVCAVFHNGQLYYLSQSEIFYIQGSGSGTFFPLPMRAKTGTQSYRGAVAVAGRGIYHVGMDGIYLYNSGIDTKITEDTLEPLFRGEDVQGIPSVYLTTSSILFTHRNYLYFVYADANDLFGLSNFIVLNMDTNRISYYLYSDADGNDIEFADVRVGYQDRIYAVSANDGSIWILEDSTKEDDDSVDISFEIQSKDFILSTRPHFPRWIKYDVDASEATTCEGSFLLGGSVLNTHAITGNRDVKRRLLEVDNGERAAHRISGTGQVSIYGTESE